MNATSSGIGFLQRSLRGIYTGFREHCFWASRADVFEVSCVRPPAVERRPEIVFRFGGRADVEAFSVEKHEYGDEEKQFGLARLAEGDSLVIGEMDGRVVFYAWQMYGQMDLDQGVIVRLTADTAYSYKVFTVSQARGKSICQAYYDFLLAFLRDRRYERLICRIGTANTASLRAHIRAGFVKRGTLWKVVLPSKALFYADAPLRVWFRNRAAARFLTKRGILQPA